MEIDLWDDAGAVMLYPQVRVEKLPGGNTPEIVHHDGRTFSLRYPGPAHRAYWYGEDR